MKRLLTIFFAVCTLFLTKEIVAASTETINTQLVISTQTNIPSDKVVILNMVYSATENPWTGEMYQPIGLCSGFFIGSNGQIITAAHCVNNDNLQGILVKTYDKKRYIAKILYISDDSDLALIKINSIDTPHFDLAKIVFQGEEIYALGHPLREEYVLTKGIVAQVTKDRTLIDITVLPGNSGCAIYNKDGKLVGVASAGFIVYFGTTGLNVAVSLRDICYFLDLFKGL